MFVDRAYNAINHIEIFCVCCGHRKFYHNFGQNDKDAQWLLMMEKKKALASISPL
jgi:hypothetical protein